MGFEDVPDRRVLDVVSKVCQGALDSVKAPSWVFLGQSQYEVQNVLPYTWSTWLLLAEIAVIPLLSEKPSSNSEKVWIIKTWLIFYWK